MCLQQWPGKKEKSSPVPPLRTPRVRLSMSKLTSNDHSHGSTKHYNRHKVTQTRRRTSASSSRHWQQRGTDDRPVEALTTRHRSALPQPRSQRNAIATLASSTPIPSWSPRSLIRQPIARRSRHYNSRQNSLRPLRLQHLAHLALVRIICHHLHRPRQHARRHRPFFAAGNCDRLFAVRGCENLGGKGGNCCWGGNEGGFERSAGVHCRVGGHGCPEGGSIG